MESSPSTEESRSALSGSGELARSVLFNNALDTHKSITANAITCKSTSRPPSPVVGQMIFESDTQLNKFWNGTAWVNTPPAGSVVQVGRYEWSAVTTMSGATFVTANSSSYTFTPLYATSKLFVFSDISVNAYYPGGPYAGATTRLLWRGSVISSQSAVAGHEHYVQAQDHYQRPAKNAVVTAGAGAGALTTQVQAYGATPTVNINQANQWTSGYTIFEVKQ